MHKLHKSFVTAATACLGFVLLFGFIIMVPGRASAAMPSDVFKTHVAAQSYSLKYVALGDSAAAGLGLPAADDASNEDVLCGRSPQVYSGQLTQYINEKLQQYPLRLAGSNAACQGAVLANLTQQQKRGETTIKPQLDAAFNNGTPSLLTMTMGANDLGWANYFNACFSAAHCATDANTMAVDARLKAIHEDLTTALSAIKARSRFLPPVTVVTGYYNPVSEQCVNPNFTAEELTWISGQVAKFNDMLQTTTAQAGWFARFAPVDFSGHDICSSDPWLQRPGVATEPAPLHPNQAGHKVMSQAILRVLGLL